jgi:Na+/H+ antiporter NhaD/arsenite permease-like protein
MAALLVGVNAGALVTPWASLAILLWHERLLGLDVAVRWPRYMAASALVAVLTVVTAVVLLGLTHA